MIESFRHKGLRQLFEDDNPKRVEREHIRKIKQILALLDAAQDVEFYSTMPAFGCIR